MLDHGVTRALQQCAQIEVVIFAEPERLVISEAMGVEKTTPHDRLQETDFPALLSRLGDIAFDKVQGGKAPPPRLERLRAGLAVSFPRKGDIVRDEIPLAFLQHGSEPPREEEIIGVENGDERRSRGFDGMVAGSRRPPVLLHSNDTQTARTVI